MSYWLKKTIWPLFMDGVQLPQGYSHFQGAVYFLPLSSKKFLVLILSTTEGLKAESTLELLSGYEHKTSGLGIQRLNHEVIAPCLCTTRPLLCCICKIELKVIILGFFFTLKGISYFSKKYKSNFNLHCPISYLCTCLYVYITFILSGK